MRLFKLALTLALLVFGFGGVNSVKAIVLGDEITSLSGITDGTKFIISDGTKANYFYGTGSGTGENEIKNAELASIPAGSYFYFTLEKYTGEDIPNTTSPADNIYRIKITNAEGTGYPYGSNSGCYLNAILNYDDKVISGPEAGWAPSGNEKKAALWYVTYDGEKGFSLKNVYRSENTGGNSSKIWLAIGNGFVADQQYLKLYSEPNDPLAEFKAALSAKIARANMYNGLAYTTASFGALTDEITTAEDALAAAASEESLTTATTTLQAKIDALELKEGFQILTADMFKSWNKADAADAVSTGSIDCAYDLFTATELPYGESSVNYLHYADLSSYTTLYVIATDKRPRMMMNRDVNEGQWNENEEDSHLIDNTKGGWSAKYFSNDGSVYSADLETMVADKGFAHLNAIKVEGWKVEDIIKGMYLYRTPDPLQAEKDALQAEINRGINQNTFARTVNSVSALSTAISDGQKELEKNNATAESLTAAKTSITNAIAALKLQDGYTNLTEDMYKGWDSNTVPTTSTNAGCDYKLNESTGQPYGGGSAHYLNFADISDFSTMYILASTGTPRIMMNRQVPIDPEAEGYDANGGAYVQITDAPVDGKVTVDLTAYDYAHLNAIKGANWANVTVTDMLLYRTITVGAAGYATFGSLYKNAKPNNVKAYTAQYNGSYLTLTEVENVPAGKGVIIEAAKGSYAPTFDVAAADIESDLLVSNGTIVGDGSTIYVLANKEKGVGFYKLKDGEKVPAGKAYLKTDEIAAPEFLGFGADVTGINEVKAVEAKGEFFNLAGQRVAQPAKGLYIANGKKVIIK